MAERAAWFVRAASSVVADGQLERTTSVATSSRDEPTRAAFTPPESAPYSTRLAYRSSVRTAIWQRVTSLSASWVLSLELMGEVLLGGACGI